MRDAKVAVCKDDAFFPFEGTEGVFKDLLEMEEFVDELHSWVMRERWPLMPQALSSNIAELATSGKLLVLAAISEVRVRLSNSINYFCFQLDRFNRSSAVGQFYKIAFDAASQLRKSEILWNSFQFAWLDGGEIISGITMASLQPPAILVFNYTTYEFYLPYDEPERMTVESVVTWLEQLADGIENGTAFAMGGRGWTTRIRRIVYEVYTNVAQMFATQPLLSCCLFGVPIAFLSIICYRYTFLWRIGINIVILVFVRPISPWIARNSSPKMRTRKSAMKKYSNNAPSILIIKRTSETASQ